MAKFDDITGKQFNRWHVLTREKSRQGRSYYLCECSCGKRKIIAASSLKNGTSKSCGCLSIETSQRLFSKDYIGKTFGHLTVIKEAPSTKTSGGQKKKVYECICDCGKKSFVRADHLSSGHTTSCGCISKKSVSTKTKQAPTKYGNRFKDITGQRFGKLTAIKRIDDAVSESGNPRTMWLCRCDCGTEKPILASGLLNGRSTSCGCSTVANLRLKRKADLTGQKFGKLHVKEFVRFYNHHAWWLCQCDCSQEVIVDTSSLTNGKVRSCGCFSLELKSQRTFEDLAGKHYGKLTVVERADDFVREDGQTDVRWRCVCDCGNERIIRAYTLKRSPMPSCGCITKSTGELIIEQALKDLGQEYRNQVRFDDLTGLGGQQLSYDFGVYKNNKLILLIEYQGEQHYHPVSKFGGEEAYKKQVIHDKLKKEYAKRNHIPLLEIPYIEKTYDLIRTDLLTTLMNL